MIGRKLAYRTIENIFRALPIWWYTMFFVPFYNFRVGVSSRLQRRLKVRLCRARVSSCSDELRKRRPFGSSDYDRRSMIRNTKLAGIKTFAKCVQCVQITVIFVYPTLGKGGAKMYTMYTVYSYFRDPLLEAESERKNYYV